MDFRVTKLEMESGFLSDGYAFVGTRGLKDDRLALVEL